MQTDTGTCSWCERARRVATSGHAAVCQECAAALRNACATKMWPEDAMELLALHDRIGRERRARRDPSSMAALHDRLIEATLDAVKTTGMARSPEVQRLRDEYVERVKAGEPSPIVCAICATFPQTHSFSQGAALVACASCLAEACAALGTEDG